jgi:hypothetical protein
LAAVVGVERAAQMLQSKKSVHLFITGEKWEFVGQDMELGVQKREWYKERAPGNISHVSLKNEV